MLKSAMTGIRVKFIAALACFTLQSGPLVWAGQDSMTACQSEDTAAAIPACTLIIDDPATADSEKSGAYASRAQALTAQANEEEARNAQDWSNCVAAEPDPGLAACSRIIENPAEFDSRRADALYHRSKRLLEKGLNAQAMADFQRSLKPFAERQPQSRERAVADYSSALIITPSQSRWLAARGQLYLSLDDGGRASDDFEQALKLNSKEGMALLGRALLRDAIGDREGSLADLKALVALPIETDEAKWLNKTATQLISWLGAD